MGLQMKEEIIVIRDPETFKVCMESNRCRIMHLLKDRDMSVNEIAKEMDKNYTTVFRHIKKLEKHGFVAMVGESRRKRTPETIYGRTAEMFIPMLHCRGDSSLCGKSLIWKREHAKTVVNTLEKMGYKNNGGQGLETDIQNLFDIHAKKVKQKLNAAGIEDNEVTFFNLIRLKYILLLMEMDVDEELEKYVNSIRSKLDNRCM